MQRAAAFFGGAVLGGIISAASGLDLFEADRRAAREEARQRAEDELQKTRSLLARAKEMLLESGERNRELAVRPGPREAAGSKAASRAASRDDRSRLLEDRIARGEAEAGQLRVEIVRLQGELVTAREALVSAALESRECNAQRHEQLLRFFARERDAYDAALVSEYLTSDRSKDEKQSLILELIKKNKEVLMSIPHDPAPAGRLDGKSEASIVPASAAVGAPGDATRGVKLEGPARERP